MSQAWYQKEILSKLMRNTWKCDEFFFHRKIKLKWMI